MSKPRRTSPLPAAPTGVCSACRVRPARVVSYLDEQGQPAERVSSSCETCQRGAFGSGGGSPAPVAAVVVEVAPISETPPAPRPVVPLTAGETVSALSASLDRVAAPPSVTAADLSRHAVRMRKAGLAPVTRETCDPHERRFFGVRGAL